MTDRTSAAIENMLRPLKQREAHRAEMDAFYRAAYSARVTAVVWRTDGVMAVRWLSLDIRHSGEDLYEDWTPAFMRRASAPVKPRHGG